MRQARIDNEENERKKVDKKTTLKNDESYSTQNIISREQKAINLRTLHGDKTKIIETVTYKNGVVKSRVKGILKGKRVVSNSGIDAKLLNGAK